MGVRLRVLPGGSMAEGALMANISIDLSPLAPIANVVTAAFEFAGVHRLSMSQANRDAMDALLVKALERLDRLADLLEVK